MNELQDKIIYKIDNLEEVKRTKELINKINLNEEYLKLMKEFEKKELEYIKKDILKEKVIELRKRLFAIDDLKEYLKLQNELRLFSGKISNVITSVVDDKKC